MLLWSGSPWNFCSIATGTCSSAGAGFSCMVKVAFTTVKRLIDSVLIG